jgi:hypothetical protein
MTNGLIIVTDPGPPSIAKLPRNEIGTEALTPESNHSRNKPRDEPDPFLHEGNRNILTSTDYATEAHLSAKV